MHRQAAGQRLDLARRCRGIRGEVRLVQHNNRGGAAVGRHEQIPLDAARIEVTIEAGDEEHGIDIGRDDLLFGRVAGRPPRKPALARQDRELMMRRHQLLAMTGSRAPQSETVWSEFSVCITIG